MRLQPQPESGSAWAAICPVLAAAGSSDFDQIHPDCAGREPDLRQLAQQKAGCGICATCQSSGQGCIKLRPLLWVELGQNLVSGSGHCCLGADGRIGLAAGLGLWHL